jgi:hypothetical protein
MYSSLVCSCCSYAEMLYDKQSQAHGSVLVLAVRIDFVTCKGSGSGKEDLADTVTLVVSILQEH